MDINFIGRDEDGLLLAEVDVEDAEIEAHKVELLRRGDITHSWIELMVGPAGMVAPEGQEPFRVLRITGRPSGAVYTP